MTDETVLIENMPDVRDTNILDVLVYGPAADIAAPRERHSGISVFSQQRPYQIVGRPDLLYIIIRNNKIRYL